MAGMAGKKVHNIALARNKTVKNIIKIPTV